MDAAVEALAQPIRNIDHRVRDLSHHEHRRPSGLITGFYNVKQSPYNAVGDSVADDAPAIQAAIDAAAADGGGVVLVPTGGYILGSGLVHKAEVTLLGAGVGATVLLPDAGVDAITVPDLYPAATYNWQVRDLQIDGGRHGIVQQGEAADFEIAHVQIGGNTGNGLVTDAVERFTLDHVRFINIAGYGWLGCQPAAATSYTRVQRATVKQCYFTLIGEDAIYWPDAPANRQPSGLGSVIQNLNCVQVNKCGFRAEHLQTLTILSPSMEHCSMAADNTYDAISLEPIAGTIIIGARVVGARLNLGVGATLGQRYGVRIVGHYCTVEGCVSDARTADYSLYIGTAHTADGVRAGHNEGTHDTAATMTGCRTLRGSATWDPPSVAAGAQTTTTVTVADSLVGDPVSLGFTQDLQGMQLTGYVQPAGTVVAVLQNGTAGAVDLASGTLRVAVERY